MKSQKPSTKSSSSASSSSFDWPPFYSNPPFFTLQPVLNTRDKQVSLWISLILSYSQFYKCFSYDLSSVSNLPLFNNTSIQRTLPVTAMIFIFDSMISSQNGEWMNKEKTRFMVYVKSPESTGEEIYKWAMDMGKGNVVLTIWEIRKGEESEDQEFWDLDEDLIIKALQALEKKGKCKLFQSSQSDESGVKFFSQ